MKSIGAKKPECLILWRQGKISALDFPSFKNLESLGSMESLDSK